MFYCVVEFKTTNSNKELSVVPLTWLIKNDQKCYWPTRTNRIPLSQFIKSCPPPKKSWPRYAVLKVHLKTENYELAEKELDRLISEYEESSNFSNQSVGRKSIISDSSETSDDEVHLKKPKTLPKPYGDVNDQSQTTDNQPLTNVNCTVLYSPIASSTSTMTFSEGGILDEALNNDIIIDTGRTNTMSIPVLNATPEGSNAHASAGPSNGGNYQQNNSEFQQTVLSAIGVLQVTTDQLLLTMQDILRYNKKISMEKLIAPDNLPSLPMKTYEDFLNFEHLIKEDPIVNQYMIRRLAALGGSGVEGVTRRIMKYLIDNQLGIQFNWKGRYNKIGFEQTSTMAIVYEAAKLNFPSNEKNDLKIAWSVKEWLKHSSTRLNQGKSNNKP